MSTSHDEQNPIRLYLLGKPDERGRDEFEQRLFADDEFLEEVMAAEDQLIDDFLTGDLTPNEVAMFEKNFLVTDERRQKLRLGKTLRTYAKQASVPVAKAKPSPARWSWRQWFSPSILRPAAVAAVILILGAGGFGFSFFQILEISPCVLGPGRSRIALQILLPRRFRLLVKHQVLLSKRPVEDRFQHRVIEL